jgi:hypothetical protein
MRESWSVRKWMCLPSRVALLLGVGALSVAGAHAGPAEAPPGAGLAAGFGDLLVRAEGGRIYLSEGGKEFHEVEVGDTAPARLLRQLLEKDGAVAGAADIRLRPTILAGSGGSGFHWAPAEKTALPDKGSAVRQDSPNKAGAPAATKPPEQTGLPGKSDKPVGAGRG